VGLISWIILGLIAGYIANRLTGQRGQGLVMNTVLGVVGAVVGGEVMTLLGRHEVTGLNIYSMAVAVAGAIIVLALARIARG
jgi:uncharacterized membrane protein YeaQ/YmgE (transglycosylase-associated protein family)